MNKPFRAQDDQTTFFIDSTLALDCASIETLPWEEIDPDGPILLIVVPSVLATIDALKRDPRDGERARTFARLIAPAALTGEPTLLRSDPPVRLAIAHPSRIDWDRFDELDPDTPDHRLVAEMLSVGGTFGDPGHFLTHRIGAMALATRLGLRCLPIPEPWLLDPEDKGHRLDTAETSATETPSPPELTLSIAFNPEPPFVLPRFQKASLVEKNRISQAVQEANLNRYPLVLETATETLETKARHRKMLETYICEDIPRYIEHLPRLLALNFAQIAFTATISNTGRTRADSVNFRMTATGATLHNLVAVFPCTAPYPSWVEPYEQDLIPFEAQAINPAASDPDVIPVKDFARTDRVELLRRTLGPGESWTIEGFLNIRPETAPPVVLDLELTTANGPNPVRTSRTLGFTREDHRILDVLNEKANGYTIMGPLKAHWARQSTGDDGQTRPVSVDLIEWETYLSELRGSAPRDG